MHCLFIDSFTVSIVALLISLLINLLTFLLICELFHDFSFYNFILVIKIILVFYWALIFWRLICYLIFYLYHCSKILLFFVIIRCFFFLKLFNFITKLEFFIKSSLIEVTKNAFPVNLLTSCHLPWVNVVYSQKFLIHVLNACFDYDAHFFYLIFLSCLYNLFHCFQYYNFTCFVLWLKGRWYCLFVSNGCI